MSSQLRPNAWGRVRYFVRRLLGRTRFDELQQELHALRDQLRAVRDSGLARERAMERNFEMLAHSVAEQTSALSSMESRLQEVLRASVTEAIDRQWTTFEDRRAPLITLIDQLRSAVEESIGAIARMDAMMLRSIEKGQQIEEEVQRRGSRLGEVLDALRATIADAVQRLEERHLEWLTAQRDTQQTLADQQALFDGQCARGFAELRAGLDSASGERLRREVDAARARERALADQTAHLIEVLAQTRRELAAASERAREADEARAAREDLQRELGRVKEDLEAAAAEIEDVREAHAAFHRWKESSDAELARLSEDRDRLLLDALRAEEARRGAHDPSFGAAAS